jgi:hypothetical protein
VRQVWGWLGEILCRAAQEPRPPTLPRPLRVHASLTAHALPTVALAAHSLPRRGSAGSLTHGLVPRHAPARSACHAVAAGTEQCRGIQRPTRNAHRHAPAPRSSGAAGGLLASGEEWTCRPLCHPRRALSATAWQWGQGSALAHWRCTRCAVSESLGRRAPVARLISRRSAGEGPITPLRVPFPARPAGHVTTGDIFSAQP